jgi:uncharacterized protein (UPF0332 family)
MRRDPRGMSEKKWPGVKKRLARCWVKTGSAEAWVGEYASFGWEYVQAAETFQDLCWNGSVSW